MNAPESSAATAPGLSIAPLNATPPGPWHADGMARQLGVAYAVQQPPQALIQPHWVARNKSLEAQLGWSSWLDGDDALALLSGNVEPPGGTLATAYSGHQFGVWAGQLGDGRALLLGEADTAAGRVEVQLKGSGLTPFSRMGDGRAVLRSSIREYLCSEAMHALGIPSTRALALVGSPLKVRRETVETAAVVTRVASSFVRFGHFEHCTHTLQDTAALRRLADAAIQRHYPDLQSAARPYAALLEAVTRRTASLLAQWQAVGFCHGVMNTDNMSIAGLTIDYGPFGFMDVFDPGHICNHTDQGGRYAYARQPNAALWNLHALARALMPLIEDSEAAMAALDVYKTAYPEALMTSMRAKLGFVEAREDDRPLVDDLLRLMAESRADMTITFRRLAGFASGSSGAPGGSSTADSGAQPAASSAVRDLFIDRAAFDAWGLRYAARLLAEHSNDVERATRMNRVNPKFVLRNHLAETAIERARNGDFSEIERLTKVLAQPFDEQPQYEADAGFPPDWAARLEVSCSS